MPNKSTMEFEWDNTPNKFFEVVHKDIPSMGHNHIVLRVENHGIPKDWQEIHDIIMSHITTMLKLIEDDLSS